MIYHSVNYEAWGENISQSRQCLEQIEISDWVSPRDALDILQAANAQTPMGNKQFLVWRAGAGALESMALSVEDTYTGEGDATRYANVPLTSEWKHEAWQSENADIWHDGSIVMTRPYGGTVNVREFTGVVFNRSAIAKIAQRWATEATTPASIEITVSRWPEEQMKEAIANCPISNRELAWQRQFDKTKAEHGWTITDWRGLWSEARGTRGMKGRPAKRP